MSVLLYSEQQPMQQDRERERRAHHDWRPGERGQGEAIDAFWVSRLALWMKQRSGAMGVGMHDRRFVCASTAAKWVLCAFTLTRTALVRIS